MNQLNAIIRTPKERRRALVNKFIKIEHDVTAVGVELSINPAHDQASGLRSCQQHDQRLVGRFRALRGSSAARFRLRLDLIVREYILQLSDV